MEYWDGESLIYVPDDKTADEEHLENLKAIEDYLSGQAPDQTCRDMSPAEFFCGVSRSAMLRGR